MARTNRIVARASRTFTLKLSASGVELFLDCHHRLCQQMSELLPYGQTLYCALLHLSRIDSVLILDDLQTLKRSGLSGPDAYFVGAPGSLVDVAARISARIGSDVPANQRPIVTGHLFVVALKRFRQAIPDELRACYHAMVAEAGEAIKIRARVQPLPGTVNEALS